MTDETATETLATAMQICSQDAETFGHHADAVLIARVAMRLHDQAEEIERLQAENSALKDAAHRSRAVEYARANPLGGPAKVFEVAAQRIRAGESLTEVMDDYGLAWTSPAKRGAIQSPP